MKTKIPLAIVTVSPPGYPHHRAFGDLAMSLQASSRILGYDVSRSTMPIAGRRSIILGWNLLDHVPWEPPVDSILFNLEQISPGSIWLTPSAMQRMRKFRIWDYSTANAAQYSMLGLTPPSAIVPIGWSETLESPIIEKRILKARSDFRYDVLFYGSMNERRLAIIKRVQKDLRVRVAFNVYGEERDALIRDSRLVLNVHYYPSNVFEIVRVSYLLANGIPVVSEESVDGEEFVNAVRFARYEDLDVACLDLIADPKKLEALGNRGRLEMKNRAQTDYLRPALETLE